MRTSPKVYTLFVLILLSSALMFTGCMQSFADSRAPGNPDFQRGKAFYNQQDYQSAITYFQRAVDSNPEGWLFRNWIGGSYFNLKNYPKTIENIEISNRGRETANNHYYLGVSNYYLGHYDKAIVHFERIDEMGKSNDQVHYYLGLVYLEKKLYNRAIAEFNQADQVKRSINNTAGLAKAYIGLKDYEIAAPYLKRWVDAESYNDTAHYLLGLTYSNLRLYDEAIKEFKRANLIKESEKSFEGLGDIYCKMQNRDDAKDAYSKALSLSSDTNTKKRIQMKQQYCQD